MLLAYIDEVGETGAFVSKAHPRYNTSPAFGYAGFVVPAAEARRFGMWFTEEKRRLFRTEIAQSSAPDQWERKGSMIFRETTLQRYPQQLRVFNALVRRLRSIGGNLFFYVDEKPIGTPKQTRLDTVSRESAAMKETLNRLARHAEGRESSLLVLMDQVNEKQRIDRMPTLYAHMFSRSNEFEEMKRIVEPPMHIDSAVSSNIQFADWVAASLSRAIDYQLVEESEHAWITGYAAESLRGSFTKESKLHLWQRGVGDIHHSAALKPERPLYPKVGGQRVSAGIPDAAIRKLRAAAERRGDTS
ncbi:uncharacterized protein DUF3800 [Microcella alkaliphila]|uniref:Uncharacterized protein DUF3800 n=1 Tax=Microcella alkaliphila TaxID=279828 RepID=A0A4Q7TSX5_9MICO|nr:DUF3800 domain-containing protein [Microcella alkaliphila]RZT63903.1 uncharacterized protein DUF3800 [Microcella alkaliphila]